RDITPANLRAFLHFGVANGAIPVLAHHRNAESVHPEDLYRFLASLAGQLSTFNARRLHPRDVPGYDHENLGDVFTGWGRIVTDLLELEVSQGYIVIPLTPVGDGRFQATIPKPGLVEPGAALILTVAAEDLGEKVILSGVNRIILASVDRLQQKI